MRRSSLIFLPFMLVSTAVLAAPAEVKVDVLQTNSITPGRSLSCPRIRAC